MARLFLIALVSASAWASQVRTSTRPEPPTIIIDNRSGPLRGPIIVETSPVHKFAIKSAKEAYAAVNSKCIPIEPTVHGFGINDLKGTIDVNGRAYNSKECPYYNSWKGMIRRRLSKEARSPTYRNVDVSPEFQYLSVFRAWMSAHDGHHEGLHLDKDLLVFDCKIYSRRPASSCPKKLTCC